MNSQKRKTISRARNRKQQSYNHAHRQGRLGKGLNLFADEILVGDHLQGPCSVQNCKLTDIGKRRRGFELRRDRHDHIVTIAKQNLEVDEVLAQLFEALALTRRDGLPPIANVVFMGMGEPLDNAEGSGKSLQMAQGPRLGQVCLGQAWASVMAWHLKEQQPVKTTKNVCAALCEKRRRHNCRSF